MGLPRKRFQPLMAQMLYALGSITYQPLAAEKGLEFSVVLSSWSPATVEHDKARLEQILRNLLSNAVKFTDQGSVQLHIRLADPSEVENTPLRGTTSRCLAFAVQDTGIGIPPDKLSLIFEAFQQVDGTVVRKYGGTGLGLSISRELTALLGGKLRVDSEPGEGSTFTLYLPLRRQYASTPAAVMSASDDSEQTAIEQPTDVAEPAEPADPAEVAEVAEQFQDEPSQRPDFVRFHGEKVLIVDDDQRGIFALTRVLEQHGLRVIHADNGVAGLRELQRHTDVRAVLMDVMMPELDGTATIAAIRTMPEYRDLPIIAVTAKAMKGDREKSLASGATEHVTKPVEANPA